MPTIERLKKMEIIKRRPGRPRFQQTKEYVSVYLPVGTRAIIAKYSDEHDKPSGNIVDCAVRHFALLPREAREALLKNV